MNLGVDPASERLVVGVLSKRAGGRQGGFEFGGHKGGIFDEDSV
jgi:hypothetical protein